VEPTHNIIDNQQVKLLDRIKAILPSSQAAHFAVGYFFLSGLEAVADVLANVGHMRLLIGDTSNRSTIEQIAEGYRRLDPVASEVAAWAYPQRQAMEAAADDAAAHIGQVAALMDQTDDAEELIHMIVRLIEEGRLDVRVYTRERFHAKAYIFDYGPIYDAAGNQMPRPSRGSAIVGSSNFTLAGVTANTELNVAVTGDDDHAALTRWFDHLWESAQDFETRLMHEMQRSWPLAQVTPYELYLKTMYELVRDQLEGEDVAEFLWRDEITAVLTDFQARAVRQAVRMIRRYRGCFVADVVGLGKSYIGAAIVKHFERTDRARPLVICPAPLVEMWEHYNEAYHLNARVLSMGMLREDDEWGPEWMLHDERYRYRDFVLVDESHNFRNTGSQRYRVLQTFLSTGDRRCVFLTATPRNKSVWDIYNQLRLFHPTDVTQIPIDPPDLRSYIKLVEEKERRLPALLSHLLIRRTRAHVLRWYGHDAETDERVDPDAFAPYREGERRAYILVGGEKHFFPERRLRTVEYSIEDTYSGLYTSLRRQIGQPHTEEGHVNDALTYARYGLWHYVRADKRDQMPYVDLQRAGNNLRGLMRVMLFKRFESSVAAFRETVQRLLRMHRQFLIALSNGIVPAGDEAQRMLYESDLDEEQALMDALSAVSGRYEASDFDVDVLQGDIAHDIDVLESILATVAPITADEDDKLQTLKRLLAQPPLAGSKVLIFTQYADTAQYLADSLDPGGARPEIEVIYSREKSKAEVVGRFAPQANPEQRPAAGVTEIETLIATDVLSEGLNLQDCALVVNYDLHWNPVRLIQRFGRIDRIGSRHDVIYAFNFLPETALERNLGLRQRLTRRIQEIHETIGEDAAILDPSEQVNPEAMYTIYTSGDLSAYEDEDDVDSYIDLHEAEELIRHLREDQPALYERITSLRDGVRCARATDRKGLVALCRAGRYRQLFLLDEGGEVVSREAPLILNLLRCEPDTPPAPLPSEHNALVMGLKRHFASEVEARRAEQQGTLRLTRAQQYVQRELTLCFQATDDADLRKQIGILEATLCRGPLRPAVQGELNRVRRERLQDDALVETLSQAYQVYGLTPVAPGAHGPPAHDVNDALPRVVCSEALV
jgi:superfamily II DNA or RNA helicase